MARHLRPQLEAEAERKGLSGAQKEAYVGGAYQRITHGQERRSFWVQSAERGYLARIVGDVHELRQPKSRPGTVVFRQGQKWYELPLREYMGLVKAGKAEVAHEERERKREAARARREEAAIRLFYREEAADRKRAEALEKRAARWAEKQRELDQRTLRAGHREEYSEVVKLVRSLGGVKLERSGVSGKARDVGEYKRLPSTVLARSGQGRTPDYVRETIHEHMPWLKLETLTDFYDYFDREREYKYRKVA